MKHPTDDEWMSYLFNELESGARTNLTGHLHGCPECKVKIHDWQAARTSLDAWRLPLRRTRSWFAQPLLKWAAAAVVMLGIGFSIGRLTSATVDIARVRAAIEPLVRRQIHQEMAQSLGEFARTIETNRNADKRAIYAALDKLESQHAGDFISLKKDLDTVAVLTDAGLRHTEQQLVQLADYTQPANSSK
jgi:hypothetical protein